MFYDFQLASEKIRLRRLGEPYEDVLMRAPGCAMFIGKFPVKYRVEGRLKSVNFVSSIADLTVSRQIAKVPKD